MYTYISLYIYMYKIVYGVLRVADQQIIELMNVAPMCMFLCSCSVTSPDLLSASDQSYIITYTHRCLYII